LSTVLLQTSRDSSYFSRFAIFALLYFNRTKKVLLKQGSVCVQVNAGPMAYASAFLDPSKNSDYPEDDLEQLRDLFRCGLF